MKTIIYSFLFVLLCVAAASPAQHPAESDDPVTRETRERMERDQRKALNKERQESLKKDMAELYKLAGELKESVDKTDENMLSLQVVRKTEQIEKLARNIRNKMKDAY
jgi:TolA-binding protein